MFTTFAIAALAAQNPPAFPPAQANAPVGQETVITYAGNGALRDWRRDPDREDVLYVRHRTERWYRVTLSGPCQGLRRGLDGLIYTTDANGTFDRFSRIRFSSLPNQSCLVRSIVRSAPPPGEPGGPPKRADG